MKIIPITFFFLLITSFQKKTTVQKNNIKICNENGETCYSNTDTIEAKEIDNCFYLKTISNKDVYSATISYKFEDKTFEYLSYNTIGNLAINAIKSHKGSPTKLYISNVYTKSKEGKPMLLFGENTFIIKY